MEEIFQQLMALLPEIKTALASNMSKMIAPAQVLGALGALFYISYRVWRSIASAEPIDFFPLLRPFLIGLIIMNFTWIPSTLDTVLSPITSTTEAMAESGQEDVSNKREQLKRMKEKKLHDEGKGYLFDEKSRKEALSELGFTDAGGVISIYAETAWYQLKETIQDVVHFVLEFIYNFSRLAINTTRILFLSVLTIFGPLIFAFALFDGFGGGIVSWFSRYINIFLWLPVCDIVTAMLTSVNGLILTKNIETAQTGLLDVGMSDVGMIIFYVIGITLYFSVPTMAGWITEGGVGAAMGGANKILSVGSSGLGAAGGFIGGTIGGVVGSAAMAGGKGIGRLIKGGASRAVGSVRGGSKVSDSDNQPTQG